MTKHAPKTQSRNWYSDDAATFGDRLAGAREVMGLSQKELGQRLGVRSKVIEAWENDVKEPRANRIQMLAGMLNVSLMWLLTGEGEGVAAPGDRAEMAVGEAELLSELRGVRTEIATLGDRLDRLESRFRLALAREAA